MQVADQGGCNSLQAGVGLHSSRHGMGGMGARQAARHDNNLPPPPHHPTHTIYAFTCRTFLLSPNPHLITHTL